MHHCLTLLANGARPAGEGVVVPTVSVPTQQLDGRVLGVEVRLAGAEVGEGQLGAAVPLVVCRRVQIDEA